MNTRVRLLIADEHAIVREGLKSIFSQAPELKVAGEAGDGAELLARLRRGGIDQLLLATSLPATGEDLIHRLRSHYPELPMLVLGKPGDPQTAQRVLRSGASGYIARDCAIGELLQAVRRLAAGGRYIDPSLAERIAFESSFGHAAGPRHERLTDRELQVLCMLAGGQTVNGIAARLAISNRTVSTHKARLMEKMGFASIAELVRYAVEQGLVD